MRHNAYRFAKRDSNHADIVAVYEGAACTVIDLSACGFGIPDILLGLATPTGRKLALVEIKSDDGTLTPAQARFNADFRGPPPRIIRSPEEALEHLRELRRP